MKKELNEELNKIKGLINKIEEGAYVLGPDGPRDARPGEKFSAFSASDFGGDDESSDDQVEPEVAIAVLQSVAERVDKLAEDLRNNFQPTEYWPYVKKMYSALKNVSDLEKMHTRSDVHGENINDVIGYIESDFDISSRDNEDI